MTHRILLCLSLCAMTARVSAQAAPAEPEAAQVDAASSEAGAGELLSATELQALGLEQGSGVDTSFHFSGFADFSLMAPIKSAGITAVYLPKNTTFYVGNINLYLSKNLSESFRTMGEIRFSYLPNGAPSNDPNNIGYTSAIAQDYADSYRFTRWGAIAIQRIYLEWTLHEKVIVRLGQFLTPYGVWNVDHGSPVYIPVVRPYAVINNFFPDRQTGLEAFGRWDANNYNTFGYHLTLSNGTGPISEYKDLDQNKAVGGRIYWELRRRGFLRIGASGYFGRDTDAVPNFAVGGDGKVKAGETIRTQYDALALAADATFELGGLHVQAEWVSQQRRYTKEGRVAHDLILSTVPRAFSKDSLNWSAYLLIGYRLRWWALMPYLMAEYDDEVFLVGLTDARIKFWHLHAGVNVHPIDAVSFKLEYVQTRFTIDSPYFEGPLSWVQAQAAWAF